MPGEPMPPDVLTFTTVVCGVHGAEKPPPPPLPLLNASTDCPLDRRSTAVATALNSPSAVASSCFS